MQKITLPTDRFEPDMTAVASAFGISIKDVHDGIEIGTISRWFEVGTGDADDKPHQIFASKVLGIRVDVDEHGVVQSSGKYQEASAVLQDNPDVARNSHLEVLLDEALNESFPASDPIAISVPHARAKSGDE